MSRDRLSELQPQNGYGAGYEGYTGANDLESGGGGIAGERYELQERQPGHLSLSDYLDEINDSKEAIARLDTQVTRIEQLHSQALNAPEAGASNEELDSLVAATSALIGSIRANLERLGNDVRREGASPDAKKKIDLVNAQRKSLRQRVQRFQLIEKEYRDKLTERAIRQYRIINPDMTDTEISTALTDPNTQIFTQALLSSTRGTQARSVLHEVQSRHNDILSIERKITELAQMFTELGVMVEMQEQPIENIARQAEQTQVTMEQGMQKVSRAARLAAAARRKKWWCFGVFLMIVVVVVVVVVVTQVVVKKSTGTNP